MTKKASRKSKPSSEGKAPSVIVREAPAKVFAKDKKGRFVSGNIGGGRPKGSRNKLDEEFVSGMLLAFEEGGLEAIRKVRDEDPAVFLNVIAKILPKQVEKKVDISISQMSDDELAAIAAGGGTGTFISQADTSKLN